MHMHVYYFNIMYVCACIYKYVVDILQVNEFKQVKVPSAYKCYWFLFLLLLMYKNKKTVTDLSYLVVPFEESL